MAGPESFDFQIFCGALIASRTTAARATLIAGAVCQLVSESACMVYRLEAGEPEARWIRLAAAGNVNPMAESLAADEPLIAPLLEEQAARYRAAELNARARAHFHVTRQLHAVDYLPLTHRGRVVGMLEVISFADDGSAPAMRALLQMTPLAGAALISAEEQRTERQELLNSIDRLSQLYDLEKSLNATLELEPVIALAPTKVRAMIPCQAVNLWMFEGDDLKLVARAGHDPTVEVHAIEAAGEGYVSLMAEEGEPCILDDPTDERLILRNAALDAEDEYAVQGAALAPLLQDGSEIGVLELINKAGKQGVEAFNDDDLFFMTNMAETLSSALKNASLLFAERKLQVLELLVQVSTEITSTLRLDRLLQIIVNSPQSVLAYERCSIALDQRGRLQLKAVSGVDSIRTGDASVESLRDLLGWLSGLESTLLVRQHDEQPEHDDEDVRAFVGEYFQATGYRTMLAVPLIDDQGAVGLLLYESSDPDLLEPAQIEMIKVISGQATVAMRNALLYREVPLITLLEPLLQGKQAVLKSSRRQRTVWLSAVFAIVCFLAFCPLPLRIVGTATVAPRHLTLASAPSDGTVQAVFVREGQRVRRGDLLGTMDDLTLRRDLAATKTRYEAQMLSMQDDLLHQSSMAGRDRTQAELLRSEVDRAQQRVTAMEIRSPIDGILETPDLQNIAGKHLEAGAPFAQVSDLSSVFVNVSVEQQDAGLLRAGQAVAIKLNSYPTKTLRGDVSIVSPEVEPLDGTRYAFARVSMANPEASLRDGMDGRAKIAAGWYPAGYVLFRKPVLWLWQTLWNWVGW